MCCFDKRNKARSSFKFNFPASNQKGSIIFLKNINSKVPSSTTLSSLLCGSRKRLIKIQSYTAPSSSFTSLTMKHT